jgi:hypothetical protein
VDSWELEIRWIWKEYQWANEWEVGENGGCGIPLDRNEDVAIGGVGLGQNLSRRHFMFNTYYYFLKTLLGSSCPYGDARDHLITNPRV